MKLMLIVLVLITYYECIQSQKIIYKCDFNDASNNFSCNGQFNYSRNDLEAGPFQFIEGRSTDLGYDLTDFTSTSDVSANFQSCNFPFNYSSIENNFCVKMNSTYKCETSNGYSSCNLGRFLGNKAAKPTNTYEMSWEIAASSQIQLERIGQFQLQFYMFYNCYQKKSFFDFFASDCQDVQERLTIYKKSLATDFYTPITVLDLNLPNSTNSNNKWSLNSINFNVTSTNLWIKVKFERVKGASKGESIFGLDSLSLISIYIFILLSFL